MIFSVTSFPARIPHIEQSLRKLLSLREAHDCLVLWLGSDKFPRGLTDVPENIRQLMDNRFEIHFVPDIRSFTKLIPALREFPEETIITFDDDGLYEQSVVTKLKQAHECNPAAIFIHATSDLYRHRGEWYRTSGAQGFRWETPGLRLVSGNGGVLYPPHALDPIVFNIDLARRLAPTNDDIWFWYAAAKKGTPIIRVKDAISNLSSIPEAECAGSLSSVNEVEGDRINRQALRNIFDYDPAFERLCLEQYDRHRFRILLSHIHRGFVHYPSRALPFLRSGAFGPLLNEIRRKIG